MAPKYGLRSARNQPCNSSPSSSTDKWLSWKKLLFGSRKKALTFESIVNGCTCSPCGLVDFMNYLLYVERAAENLQFYLWYQDYIQRFASLSESQWALSPPWTEEQRKKVIRLNNRTKERAKRAPSITGAFVPAPAFPPVGETELDDLTPFATRPSSSHIDFETSSITRGDWFEWDGGSKAGECQESIDESSAFDGVVPLEPFTIQPHRKEINRIISTYISDNAPRQLNLTSIERIIVMQALSATTHPSAFAGVVQEVEWNLRQQSHPQFLRWSLNNSNSSRLLCARVCSMLIIAFGLALAIVLVFSKAHRGWRMFSALLLFPGIASLIAAMEGTCMLFLCFYKRQLHPWEVYGATNEAPKNSCRLDRRAFDAFGLTNSYDDEPWRQKNKKRGFFSKVFDPPVRIQDPTLCQLQTMTIIRSTTLGTAITGVLVGIFMTLPNGNYF
ncbi:hypothetical protein MGYG_00231 [Nannizzia gypsea CBS 118893]|uniref:RGS domain-containing protein n=1 Tax=Arthroderma gypseum (strain ATCC MYA-4604 / CBS 118893) TaxID=535722 RepID=E5QY96_ARTGP|nr:hypothetical protein MGYG_00231 [Nannizzia gypsea CBS 118893]EFQ97188.1 hypothetical protein MGYG_00231 [Nannizzia gypsea CBS 118893]